MCLTAKDNPTGKKIVCYVGCLRTREVHPLMLIMLINTKSSYFNSNTLSRHRINVIGAVVFVVVSVTSLFMNLSLAHITSVLDVYIDQVPICSTHYTNIHFATFSF